MNKVTLRTHNYPTIILRTILSHLSMFVKTFAPIYYIKYVKKANGARFLPKSSAIFYIFLLFITFQSLAKAIYMSFVIENPKAYSHSALFQRSKGSMSHRRTMISASCAYSAGIEVFRYLLRIEISERKKHHRPLAIRSEHSYSVDFFDFLLCIRKKISFVSFYRIYSEPTQRIYSLAKSRYRGDRQRSRLISFGALLRHFARQRIDSVSALKKRLHFNSVCEQYGSAPLRSK